MIRVLLADDSLLTRVALKDILNHDPEIIVVAEVADGRRAVEETVRLQPDLVILDVMMPVMDGLTAVSEIMSRAPTPILMLSAHVAADDSSSAFNAIRLGALDVMPKPEGLITDTSGELAARIIERVKTLSRVRVMHHFRPSRPAAPPLPLPPQTVSGGKRILAIGASTGGPKVVMRLMKEFPAGRDVRIVIVQHIANGFAAGFAEWLDRESPYHVRLAQAGDRLERGIALVAPNHLHLEVVNEQVVLSETPPVNCCRPAVDVLFRSLATDQVAPSVAAVLLTGMGRDGADGLLALRQHGAHTIAQDEATCAVFGMPRAAIENGGAAQVLAIGDIPAHLGQLFDA